MGLSPTSSSPGFWHARFRQQAGWTEAVRRYLFSRLSLNPNARLLEVGCGTGAITAALGGYAQGITYGIDIDLPFLKSARSHDSTTRFAAADALRLPFPGDSFDVVFCHFFLLWISDPQTALAEMARIARPGGALLALAEPDYGGRIDYPPALAGLGTLQSDSLRRQGADPQMGRKLSALFHAAGLLGVETGVLGGQWGGSQPGDRIAVADMEWDTLVDDLHDTLPPGQLASLLQVDREARASGSRVLYVPTFWASGRKP